MYDTYGQGDQTLTRAAGLVADAQSDFDRLAAGLSAQIIEPSASLRAVTR